MNNIPLLDTFFRPRSSMTSKQNMLYGVLHHDRDMPNTIISPGSTGHSKYTEKKVKTMEILV